MRLISTQTLSTAQASIEFTSIPQTFTDLVVLISGRADGSNGTINCYFNTDTTSANYSVRRLIGDGTNATSGSFTGAFFAYVNLSTTTTNSFSNSSIYIPNYTSSTAKSISGESVWENNATYAEQTLNAGLWSGTAAITRILINLQVSPNFVAGSTFSLYGILRGTDGIVTTSP